MKKTDVTQPVAMATPFAEGVYSATSTDDFEIPAATSTTADDSCVMDDGFLPITSTALDDGGKAPERKNFNGMFYLSTDQRFFLQNGGFITYNPDVATAIGGYPQDAILDFIDSNGNYKKVRSLIDDNSNNFVLNESLIDGVNWEEALTGANIQLSNVDSAITSIPPTALTNFDGAWVLSDIAIVNNGSISANRDYTYDLSTVLPSDFSTFNYEVFFAFQGQNGSDTGNALRVIRSTDNVDYFGVRSPVANKLALTSCTVPIFANSSLTIRSAAAWSTVSLVIRAYRRIGTNQ